jgi:hypothetical protein
MADDDHHGRMAWQLRRRQLAAGNGGGRRPTAATDGPGAQPERSDSPSPRPDQAPPTAKEPPSDDSR